jgi:hypothetical protein
MQLFCVLVVFFFIFDYFFCFLVIFYMYTSPPSPAPTTTGRCVTPDGARRYNGPVRAKKGLFRRNSLIVPHRVTDSSPARVALLNG